jgi:hypothetical protein
MAYVVDNETASRLSAQLLHPSISKLESSVGQKLVELLKPHIDGHPITYNHYLTENVQKAQLARHDSKMKQAFSRHFDLTKHHHHDPFVPADVLSSIMKTTEPNMENYAAMLAIDTMEAYYKVIRTEFCCVDIQLWS